MCANPIAVASFELACEILCLRLLIALFVLYTIVIGCVRRNKTNVVILAIGIVVSNIFLCEHLELYYLQTNLFFCLHFVHKLFVHDRLCRPNKFIMDIVLLLSIRTAFYGHVV